MSVSVRWPIHTIVTHPRPHLDELAAVWAARRFGEEKYPGAEGASLEYFSPETHLDGRSEDEWLGDGFLFVGVRGGRFDDHPHHRFPSDCAFTLLLKDLGKEKDPGVQKIARDVLTEDRNGAPSSLHLASIIKAKHRVVGILDVARDVDLSLEALYAQQLSFHEAVDIVRKIQPICVFNEQTQRQLILVIAESENPDISPAARWKEGAHAALVVHRHPVRSDGTGGTTYISTNDNLGIQKVGWLVKELRWAEQAQKGEIVVRDQQRLQADGVLPEIPEWYHHEAAAQIYNGSLTAPNVPRTRLSLKQIEDLCVRFLHSYPRFRGRQDERI